jgi:glycosyltransferase involved in cell wall biosynthesis
MRVVMAESSDIYRDGRVQKEACSLVEAGHDVRVFGFRSDVGARRKFPFRLATLPILSRKHGRLRKVSIFISTAILSVRLLFIRADVYHAHNTMFLISLYLASRLYGGKFIYDCHEVQAEAGRIQHALERRFIHRADAIINVSEGRAAHQAAQYHVLASEILVIHNYPELPEELGPMLPEGATTRLVFSGGFHLRDNRLDDFLRILKGVPHVELDLIAFGYGDSGRRLDALIEELGLRDRVRFLPLVPYNKLMRTLTSYDLAVNMLTNPEQSISKRYPAINKTYEYLAAGLPIICSNLEAFEEEVVGQGVGISIDPTRMERGRDAVRAFISDRDGREVMRETARRLAVEKYNWATESCKLKRLYSTWTTKD